MYVVNGHIKMCVWKILSVIKSGIVAILNIPSADKNEHSRMDGKINQVIYVRILKIL